MAVPAADVVGVVQTATAKAAAVERANQQRSAGDSGASPSSGFDTWSHTAAGMGDRDRADPMGPARAVLDGVAGEWSRADSGAAEESLDRQATDALKEFQLLTGQREPDEGEAAPEGFLAGVGATFGVLTSLEQMISAPLAMLPFPAFPAIRVTDMDVGLPHGHTHPPNTPPPPPAPPVMMPSTGPIIPIPFLSGATQTLINGMPAARCGDMGLGVWCGGYFPMYEVFLGSSSVWIEGARAGRLLVDVTRHCMFSSPRPQDPAVGPMVGMTITSSPNVLIGGVPMPSLLDMAMGAAIQGLFKGIGKAVKKAKALKQARALREADEIANRMANTAGPSGKRPRPTHFENMDRVRALCGGDAERALDVWAAGKKLVHELMDEGSIRIEDGGDALFRKQVMQDLYMVAASRTGKRQLEKIAANPYEVTIKPQSASPDPAGGASAYPKKYTRDPQTGEITGDHLYDGANQKAGLGEGTDIFYDPSNFDAPGTPPDCTLNHELGHAANNAAGTNKSRMSPGPGNHNRFPHLEEENVIQNVDNAYRREYGLPTRWSWGHLP